MGQRIRRWSLALVALLGLVLAVPAQGLAHHAGFGVFVGSGFHHDHFGHHAFGHHFVHPGFTHRHFVGHPHFFGHQIVIVNPPVVIVDPPVVTHIWVPGQWYWTGSAWVWVPGHWR